MRLLHYVEIENFKRFGAKQRISLEHPAVIIGPNNCGKTSAIQALALWSLGVRTWYANRRESKASQRVATPLNRLNIVAVPVPRIRFFWRNAKVRTGNQPIIMSITVGVERKGKVEPVTMQFKSQSNELAYCEPGADCADDIEIIRHAAGIAVELLYPMSGIETEEPVIQSGRINVLLGKGQTAQVLRNLCLIVARDNPEDWTQITALMKRLFQAELMDPLEDEVRGIVELSYKQEGVMDELDISMAGRGFHQMLLIFAYLFSHKRSVLLIDEPDAHLEILRQRQVYVLLRDIAIQNESQVVMVTHSEVVLNEAKDTNLTLVLNGIADDLSSKGPIKQALQQYGAEHYVRARETQTVIYVEGSTDIDMLRAFAQKLNHPVAPILDEGHRLNVYYLQDNHPQNDRSIDVELERVEGGYGISAKDHFFALRTMVPALTGIAIRDGDARQRRNEDNDALKILFWSRYEPENYFISPKLLREYALSRFNEHDLFESAQRPLVDRVLKTLLEEKVFDGSESDFEAYESAEPKQQELIWRAQTAQMKLSTFAEEFFRRVSRDTGTTMLLRKGTLHELVSHCSPDELNGEVSEKLDAIHVLLDRSQDLS